MWWPQAPAGRTSPLWPALQMPPRSAPARAVVAAYDLGRAVWPTKAIELHAPAEASVTLPSTLPATPIASALPSATDAPRVGRAAGGRRGARATVSQIPRRGTDPARVWPTDRNREGGGPAALSPPAQHERRVWPRGWQPHLVQSAATPLLGSAAVACPRPCWLQLERPPQPARLYRRFAVQHMGDYFMPLPSYGLIRMPPGEV